MRRARALRKPSRRWAAPPPPAFPFNTSPPPLPFSPCFLPPHPLLFTHDSTNLPPPSQRPRALVSAGRLDVTWQLTADGDCTLIWQESRGPKVSPPKRKGFETVLISPSVPYDLAGDSNVENAASGFRARSLLPAKHVSRIDIRTEKKKAIHRPPPNRKFPATLLPRPKKPRRGPQTQPPRPSRPLGSRGAPHTGNHGKNPTTPPNF